MCQLQGRRETSWVNTRTRWSEVKKSACTKRAARWGNDCDNFLWSHNLSYMWKPNDHQMIFPFLELRTFSNCDSLANNWPCAYAVGANPVSDFVPRGWKALLNNVQGLCYRRGQHGLDSGRMVGGYISREFDAWQVGLIGHLWPSCTLTKWVQQDKNKKWNESPMAAPLEDDSMPFNNSKSAHAWRMQRCVLPGGNVWDKIRRRGRQQPQMVTCDVGQTTDRIRNWFFGNSELCLRVRGPAYEGQVNILLGDP